MKISVITLFPKLLESFLNTSIISRAKSKNITDYKLVDLREFGIGKHQTVDDRPYGGGAGMVLRADVLAKALDFVIKASPKDEERLVILTSPQGKTLSQDLSRSLTSYDHLIIICGHYEGVDQRFIDRYVNLEISIGDYILTGGELPAMVVIDSIVRLLKGVLAKEEATLEESFENGVLEQPHYTRPDIFEDLTVPSILISGNHKKIKEWKRSESILVTTEKRPDLIKKD